LTVDQAPAITSASSTTFVSGIANSFPVTATGYPAPTFTLSGNVPTGVTINPTTGVLSGNPPASVSGTYNFTITASNTETIGGVATVVSATQAFTLIVNQAATFTSAASFGVIAGTGGSFTVTASGVPTPTLAETTSNPTGVTFNAATGLLSIASTTAAGIYHLTFTASNVVGTATQNFTLSVGQVPAITSASSTTFTVGTSGSFTVTTTGNPSPTVSYTGTLPSGLTFNAGTFSGTPAAGTGGVYNLTITASNGVGAAATQSFTLTVNQGTAITSASSASFITGTGGSFTVTATGFPAPTLSQTASLPSGVTFNPTNGVLTVAPNALPGTYALTFKATNGVGTAATQSFTLNINQSPAITSAASTTFTVGTAGSFQVTTTGYPAPTVTYSGTLPAGLTLNNNGVLSGTPAAGTGGVYSLTITASNGVGAPASQTFTLTVNQAAAITSPASTVVQLGVASTFTVTTSGFPAPTLSETAALPTGVTFNATTGVLSISAKVPLGTYHLNFTASNNVGAVATQTFTLFVGEAPAITSANRTTFAVGTAGSFTVTTTGFPAATVTESGNLPNGVTFNSSTGVLSGTPQPLSGGVYTLTFTANNGIGTVATQTFTLFVDERPSFTSVNNTSFTVGQPGKFAVTVAGFPAASLSESGALPTGITFNTSTGILSGTPTSGDVGTFNIVFTASSKLYGSVSQNFTLHINPGPVAFFALQNNSENNLKNDLDLLS
jgi:hypothetical protein